MNNRTSGILLHPTSLPETPGIGTIGKQAYKFVDWLEKAGQSLWQILPIGPTGYGDSPYASFSTFAGNPLIIDLEMLKENGCLSEQEMAQPEWINNSGYIDYGAVVYWKIPVLKTAARNFLAKTALCTGESSARELCAGGDSQSKMQLCVGSDSQSKMQLCAGGSNFCAEFNSFCRENAFWLDDYALFMSIKDEYDAKAKKENRFGAMWANYWPKNLATRKLDALEKWASEHKAEIEAHKAIQFFFFSQWSALKKYANEKGIKIIGDIPIFVAYDSSDVWANQALFQLDKTCKPKVVAGVPPDYFSATGQLWGNPLYDWTKMKKDGYAWWLSRIRSMLSLVDYVRIDHFRGFEAYWAIPFGEETAINGKWVKGPDHALFNAIKKELGEIPIIAEDLGLITDEVRALREDFSLPGMKVLQFAFSVGEEKNGKLVNAFLPHEYNSNFVVYTGTHDNETMKGYLDNASEEEISLIKKYLSGGNEQSVKDDDLCPLLVKEAFASIAKMAVVPVQDVYAVGSNGRMNTPSTSCGRNWQWRMDETMLEGDKADEKAKWLKTLSTLYDRN